MPREEINNNVCVIYQFYMKLCPRFICVSALCQHNRTSTAQSVGAATHTHTHLL